MARYGEMILNGHGGWNLQQEPAWAQVPKGTTIKFLTENMRLLCLEDIDSQETADRLLEQFRSSSPDQEGTEYKYVPNYVLSDDGVTGAPEWVYKVAGDKPLCTSTACDSGVHRCDGVFADPEVVGATLYWAACRFVELEEAGDLAYHASTGVNMRSGYGMENPEGLTYEFGDAYAEEQAQRLEGLPEDEAMAELEALRAQLTPEQFEMVARRIGDQIDDEDDEDDEDDAP